MMALEMHAPVGERPWYRRRQSNEYDGTHLHHTVGRGATPLFLRGLEYPLQHCELPGQPSMQQQYRAIPVGLDNQQEA